jgi:FkbM family methyltransferase
MERVPKIILIGLAYIYLRISPKWKVSFSLIVQDNSIMFLVMNKADNQRLVISQIRRIYKYKNGVESRLDEISAKYMLHKIDFKVVKNSIDIGSNIGEFSVSVKRLSPNTSVTLVEPEADECRAARLNLPDSRIESVFLDEFERKARFRKANSTGDSGLLFEDEYQDEEVHVCKTNTLNELSHQLGGLKFDLIKIEAEGWEPEVVRGGLSVISLARYVVIDGSAERSERGVKVETLSSIIPLMCSIGFELLHSHNHVGLFFKGVN